MKDNVLVTAAGSIVAQGIIKSLKLANRSGKRSYRVISADMSPMAAGLYRTDSGVIVPPADSDEYVGTIASICTKMDIQAVYCGSDNELLVLSAARKEIEETGARLLVGDLDALTIARDKWRTFQFCRANNLVCAPSCLPVDAEGFTRDHGYPVVVKPREGYGSLHMYVARTDSEVEQAILAIHRAGWRPIIQKFIKGDLEFTAGVTIDSSRKYVMSSISIKKIIKNGQTHRAFIDDYDTVRKSAEATALRLRTWGAINVQTKTDHEGDEPQIIEINPRFSATCPMRSVAGINEPDIIFRNAVLGEDIKITSYDKLFCARYLNEIFVPLEAYKAVAVNPLDEISNTKSFVVDYF